ncbi:hypothetical protein LshimejAT787_1103290 [Lyophyllum shimeji]|uniref:Uncharacterized protein n=1 Tax=Lyophyllum shimeji TaxID=47721 RepID=A0A9P3PVK2_LYOSH|nr:hypothetical protein LshimejAT787_1103290 [Lyophyllum shimeji]
MAHPHPYPQEKPLSSSQSQQFQMMDRLSSLPSSSWPTYYDQPHSWPVDPAQHQLYRPSTSAVEYDYTAPRLPSSSSCHAVAAFPPASCARDPVQASPHSSPSPFDDVEDDPEISRPLPLLTSSFSPKSASCRGSELHHRPPPKQSPSPTPSVKEEPDDADGRFIMEISPPQAQTFLLSQSLAPPTEVPLRATQASSQMRSMMTVFRLNPFAMHDGEGRGTIPVQHEAAHALEAEPLIFEFQLDLDNMDLSVNVDPGDPSLGLGLKDVLDAEPLRSFSPDFELHEVQTVSQEENDGSDWPEYLADASHDSPVPVAQTWELGFPQSEDRFSTLSSSTNMPRYHSGTRRQPRLHHSISHPYLKAAAGGDGYTTSSSSGVHIHNQDLDHAHTHSYTHTHHAPRNHTHDYNYEYIHTRQYRVAPTEVQAQVHHHHPQWTAYSSSSSSPPSRVATVGYHDPVSRSSSTMYVSSASPGCDRESLPSMSAVAVRRWSLPDAHPHHGNIHAPAPLPFLV